MITNPKTAKAIETHYAGYRMRSRLEARWARFFDAMWFSWEYEPEGFALPSGPYLPDFYLPRVKMWCEAKPEPFNDRELQLAKELVIATKHPLIMLDGVPDTTNYWALFPPECGNNEVYWMDIIWNEGRNYYSRENRFFASTGGSSENWRVRTQYQIAMTTNDPCPFEDAVVEARSERFGERQDWYAKRIKPVKPKSNIEALRENI